MNDSIARNDRVRDEVLRRLKAVDGGAYMRDLGSATGIDATERRRITEYTSGITRWRRWLDFLIDYWSRAGATVHPVVRNVLRIGAYELVILGRPSHVVVNASVEQAKRQMKGGRSGSFVNAILRQITRNANNLPEPATGDPIEDLAIRHSHPTWMVRRWVSRYGREDTGRLLEWNNTRPRFGVRVNTLETDPDDLASKLSDLGVSWSRSRYAKDFLVVDSLQPMLASGLIDEGEAAIQDESAGLVVELLGARDGDFLIDACAAPGGKLIRAAIDMRGQGRIVAIDPNEKRLRMASDFARRHGITHIQFHPVSFLDWMPPQGTGPDKILLDVPCSGLGVLGRRADLRWQKDEAGLIQLSHLQDRLLDRAAELLAPGGILLYATCTLEPEENEERVDAFLKRRTDFHLVPADSVLPKEVTTREGYLATLPQRHGIDGAFAAKLQKGN